MADSIFARQTGLPYVRDLAYFSPSSFMLLEEDPARFYLRKLGPEEFKPPYRPQTLGMAVGSAFDASVKSIIAERFNLPCPSYPKLIADTVQVPLEPWADLTDPEGEDADGRPLSAEVLAQWEPWNPRTPQGAERVTRCFGDSPWEHSVKLGHQLAAAYDSLGLIDAEYWVGVEVHTDVGFVPTTGGEGVGVPVFGQLDGEIQPDPGRLKLPLDWKVAGGAMPGQVPSPNPGYVRLYDTAPERGRKSKAPLVPGLVGGPHKKSTLPMHLWGGWGAKWAVQLTVYSWLQRGATYAEGACGILEPLPVALDQLICHPCGRVRVAQYRTEISVDFQISLIRRFVEAWKAVQEETLVSYAASIEELSVAPRVGWW